MVTTARGYPRFLPTLTEVVRAPAPDPAVLEAARLAAEAARREEEAARRQEVVEHMRALVLTAIDDKIQDMVAGAMLEQVDQIGERLRRQMDDMVRESFESVAVRLRAELEVVVDEAVDAVLAAQDPGAKPPADPVA